MASFVKLPVGTKAGLDALALAGTLVPQTLYAISDQNRIALALTASTYETLAKESESASYSSAPTIAAMNGALA